MDIVELIYRPEDAQGPSKDYEFSRATMERRWKQGLNDARLALESAPWLVPAPPDVAVRTFDVAADKAVTAANPAGQKSSLSEPVQQKVATHG
jgi:NTE family protein